MWVSAGGCGWVNELIGWEREEDGEGGGKSKAMPMAATQDIKKRRKKLTSESTIGVSCSIRSSLAILSTNSGSLARIRSIISWVISKSRDASGQFIGSVGSCRSGSEAPGAVGAAASAAAVGAAKGAARLPGSGKARGVEPTAWGLINRRHIYAWE